MNKITRLSGADMAAALQAIAEANSEIYPNPYNGIPGIEKSGYDWITKPPAWPRKPSWDEVVLHHQKIQADRYINGPDDFSTEDGLDFRTKKLLENPSHIDTCLLYTSPSPRDS